jgi:hypothetical protein
MLGRNTKVHKYFDPFSLNYIPENCKETVMGGAHSTDGRDKCIQNFWEDNFKMDLGKWGGKVWTGCMWLRIVSSGGLL